MREHEALRAGDSLPAEVLERAVEGVRLRGDGTLGGEFRDRPTLLAFLRHFG